MHERTDELTYADASTVERGSRVGNARASIGQVYLVEWPDHLFVKVGLSTRRRWTAFLRRGGVLRCLYEPTDRHASIEEAELHATIRAAGFSPAFACKADAAPFLGNGGAGWTECYRVGEGKSAQLIAIDELAARRRGA